MLLALALFGAGILEYIGAAYWTRAVVGNDVGRASAATFFNVMVWGFVVANLKLAEPQMLVVHGLGCALGAGLTCAWARRREGAAAEDTAEAETEALDAPTVAKPRVAPEDSAPVAQLRFAPSRERGGRAGEVEVVPRVRRRTGFGARRFDRAGAGHRVSEPACEPAYEPASGHG
jgi:hypothetical protein